MNVALPGPLVYYRSVLGKNGKALWSDYLGYIRYCCIHHIIRAAVYKSHHEKIPSLVACVVRLRIPDLHLVRL